MKKTSLLILLAGIFIPAFASAQTIATMLENILTKVVQPVAVFAVITLWVVTGILFLTAQGDPGKLDKARQAMIWAIVGTAITVLAPFMATIVGNSLL